MRKKLFCNKINKDVTLTFDLVDARTFGRPNHYLIGLIRNCSACTNNICDNCSLVKELCGKSIDLSD